MSQAEQKFLDALKDVFIGAKVEGQSGYINLMRIKARYFEQGVFPRLREDINRALEPFPQFRDELFDKLYDFFHRYFSESGSIYFRYTPLHERVYEQVYTDDRDVMLFWKTQRLYYVKTDRLFQNMEVEVEGLRFAFDVSTLEHKKANEKRALVYEFAGRRADGALRFTVTYSERGRQTRTDDILRQLREAGVRLSEDALQRAFALFERQSEVDYFINKDARGFLREQFDLWMYQYIFSGETQWTETRIRQLQTLKAIACKIIDFIAQFEDELARIWNKPKFVRNSHYVITLDRIAAQDAGLLRRLLDSPGLAAQLAEWRALGLADESFTPEQIWQRDLLGERLHPRWQFLPLDTRHFPDLEAELIAAFDHLDQQLDGWLIHSENYQALNTLLPKFRERVKCIHIDPPYNTDTSGFLYTNNYQHASWLTMMENRISLGLDLLEADGSFLCHADENEYERLKVVFDQMGIADAGTIVWDKRNPMTARRGIALQHEYILWRSEIDEPIPIPNDSIRVMLAKAREIVEKHGRVTPEAAKEYAEWVRKNPLLSGGEKAYIFLDEDGRVYQSVSLRAPEPRTDPKFFEPLIHPITGKPCPVPPNGFSRTPETLQAMAERGEILFGPDETTQPRQKRFLTDESQMQVRSIIQDANKGKSYLDALGLNFAYCHPVSLYETLLGAAASDEQDVVLDFFAGSGTTAHAVINLNRQDGGRRKYILVEMAEYFDTVLLPRIKKVVFSDKWKDGRAQNGQGISQFVKYYELEQYEDVLRRARYEDADLFDDPYRDPYSSYVFLRDLKMLDAVELDAEKDEVRVHLDRLYPDIDVAETLSCVTGRWIRRVSADEVEFEDGGRVSLRHPDWRLVKPLIWW